MAEAERLYRQVLQSEPDNADALHLLGVIAHAQGMSESAVELIERAHRAQPPHPISLNSLGKAYFGLHHLREARKSFGKALALKPDYAEAHNNLGAVLAALGQTEEAVDSYNRALALHPEYPEAHFNLGNALDDLGQPEKAESCYRRALALQPGMVDALVNLGHVLQDLARSKEAEQCYRQALAVNPDSPEALSNLGGVLKEFGRPEEAEQIFRKALALKPDSADVHYSLGNVLHDLGRLEDAGQSYLRAYTLKPDHAEALWALTISRLPSLEGAEPDRGGESAGIAEIRKLGDWIDANCATDGYKAVGALQPFYLAYRDGNHRDVLAEYGRLCGRLMQRWREQQRFRPAARAAGGAIRVGIVSAHVHDHSVWNAIVKGWLRHLNRERFDLRVFHVGAKQDAETAFARSRVTLFEHGPRGLRQWVEAILGQQLDALIYPEIGMDPQTVKLAALRLAPVQLAAWGHPETTGLPTIDYYLSAEMFEPADAQQHYTERLLALPNLGCSYEPLSAASVDPDLAVLGIDRDGPLFLCPGVPFKYAPGHDWIFTEIARRLERCRFVFFALEPRNLSEKLSQRLRSEFARAYLDFERHVVFIPPQPRPAFRGLMQRADVFLDTIGFSGFNTAMQAVECGLPIVTREGRFMRGRFASGILKRMRLPELVAASDEDYIALAVRLARDSGHRNDIRARIEASRHLLYDDPAPIRSLEDFLIDATRRN